MFACLVMEGVQSVFGEYEMAYFGLSKEQMVTYLIIGCAATILVGTCLGMLSDLMYVSFHFISLSKVSVITLACH